MSQEFDKQLRSAFRPVDPGEDFTQRVLARAQKAPQQSRNTRFPRFAAALAASVLVGVVVFHHWQMNRREQGLEARRQLIEALRVTGEKLDVAYEVVNNESQS